MKFGLDIWQMKLNIEKCVTMISTHTVYYTHEHPIDITDQHDYLGIKLHHIQLKVNKVTKASNEHCTNALKKLKSLLTLLL